MILYSFWDNSVVRVKFPKILLNSDKSILSSSTDMSQV